ncbi:MAG TPA: EAL domain-containing protein, partial [Polyangiaceae bacterium]|nr:EAL domain-containing protein [Polyangiaceae bacterium]
MAGSRAAFPKAVAPEPVRVLVVEDEAPLRRAFVRVLERAGFQVEAASDGLAARTLIAAKDFHVVLSDVSMPGMDGVSLLRSLRQGKLELPVILMSGLPEVDAVADAVQYGACQFLMKPVELGQLQEVVRGAAERWRETLRKRHAPEPFESGKFPKGDRAALEMTFSLAIDGLWMAYQPIVDAKARTLFGYEAFLRTTEASFPDPGSLLDAAELLAKLDDIGQAVRSGTAGSILDTEPGSVVFLNLHTLDLRDPSLTADTAPLSKFASRVVLEITERAPLAQVDGFLPRIAELRAMGFRIAIDDLGAGYAGLTSFAALEPDFVKLDMSLIRDVHRSATQEKLVRAMTSRCRDLGMLVVAEGVETPEERDLLVDAGCDLLQGYL